MSPRRSWQVIAGPCTAALVAIPFEVLSASGIPQGCAAELDRQWIAWRPASINPTVKQWSAEHRFNPAVARGDFNGDGKTDTAVLVQLPKSRAVGVCMAGSRGIKLIVIKDPYCSDWVLTMRRGTTIHDIETGTPTRLLTDAINVTCFGAAGATYFFDGGRFERVVDDD